MKALMCVLGSFVLIGIFLLPYKTDAASITLGGEHCSSGNTVNIAVNGTVVTTVSCINTDGTFTSSPITVVNGDLIAAYIVQDPSKPVEIIRSNGTSITNLFYAPTIGSQEVRLRNQLGSALTNVHLDTAHDGSARMNNFYLNGTGSNLSAKNLFTLWTGNFTPGGNITRIGDLNINAPIGRIFNLGSNTVNGSGTFLLQGDFASFQLSNSTLLLDKLFSIANVGGNPAGSDGGQVTVGTVVMTANGTSGLWGTSIQMQSNDLLNIVNSLVLNGFNANNRITISGGSIGMGASSAFSTSGFLQIISNQITSATNNVPIPINPPNSLDGGNTIGWFGFDFSLSNDGNQTVAKGSYVTSTITASLLLGTAEPVTYSVAGLPAGATGAFNPTNCTPTCSTILTITTTAATPTGTSTIIVTGVAGAVTRTTSFTLTVTPPTFDFSLSTVAPVTIQQNTQLTRTITATLLAGSTTPVTYTVSGLPSGVTGSFSPTACNPTCPTTLTLAASAGATGSSTATVTATGGNVSRSTTFTVTVSGTPTGFDFSFTNPSGIGSSTVFGQPTSIASPSLLVTTQQGTPQPVSFSIVSVPAGIQGLSVPTSSTGCTPTPSTCSTSFQMNTNGTTPVGTYTIQVTATSGVISRVLTFPLQITASASQFDFALSMPNPAVGINQGSTTQRTATATYIAGGVESATFGLSALPAGITASINPTICGPISCSTTITFDADDDATLGSFIITLSATSTSGVVRTFQFTLAIAQGYVSTNPTDTPPNSIIEPPINMGSVGQIKDGGLGLGLPIDSLLGTYSLQNGGLTALLRQVVLHAGDLFVGFNPAWSRGVGTALDINGTIAANHGQASAKLQVPIDGTLRIPGLVDPAPTSPESPLCVNNGTDPANTGKLQRCGPGAGGNNPGPSGPVTISVFTATSVNPTTATSGGTTTLTWASTGARKCSPLSGPGFETAGAVSGTDTSAVIKRSQSFSVMCWNDNGGVAVKSVYVPVRVIAPVVTMAFSGGYTSGQTFGLTTTINDKGIAGVNGYTMCRKKALGSTSAETALLSSCTTPFSGMCADDYTSWVVSPSTTWLTLPTNYNTIGVRCSDFYGAGQCPPTIAAGVRKIRLSVQCKNIDPKGVESAVATDTVTFTFN